jgi:DNA repair protein RecO (recombination protein O)
MQWGDDGIVLGVRRHGESSVILEAMTREHGRHLGLVRGGRSRRLQPVLQPGNLVRLAWRARIDEHLGAYAVEGVTLHAARFMRSRLALFAVTHVAGLLRLLAERDPHPALYDVLPGLLDQLDDPRRAPALVASFEIVMLEELGFGLDLSRCASTGSTEDLAFVSPRTGRAVSREAGRPFAERLFRLPPFLLAGDAPPSAEDIADAFRLAGHFLERDVFAPRGLAMPEGRRALVEAAQTSSRA